jgi:hypothetical protein
MTYNALVTDSIEVSKIKEKGVKDVRKTGIGHNACQKSLEKEIPAARSVCSGDIVVLYFSDPYI